MGLLGLIWGQGWDLGPDLGRFGSMLGSFHGGREETEIIEGEVVEIQIDRPATGTVRLGGGDSNGGGDNNWGGS